MSCAPGPAPCGSCPYRRDVPSGVWDAEEYEKLPRYDQPTALQPSGVFYCHQQDGRVCAGWAATHDMDESLALRLAAASGAIAPPDVEAVREYRSPVPLFASGREAAAHGLAELESPGPEARRAIKKLSARRVRQARSQRASAPLT